MLSLNSETTISSTATYSVSGILISLSFTAGISVTVFSSVTGSYISVSDEISVISGSVCISVTSVCCSLSFIISSDNIFSSEFSADTAFPEQHTSIRDNTRLVIFFISYSLVSIPTDSRK